MLIYVVQHLSTYKSTPCNAHVRSRMTMSYCKICGRTQTVAKNAVNI